MIKYKVVRPAKTVTELDDFRRFSRYEKMRMEALGEGKPLSPKNMTGLSRVETRLHRAGILAPITRSELRARGAEMFAAMPFRKRVRLRLRFWWAEFRVKIKTKLAQWRGDE